MSTVKVIQVKVRRQPFFLARILLWVFLSVHSIFQRELPVEISLGNFLRYLQTSSDAFPFLYYLLLKDGDVVSFVKYSGRILPSNFEYK